MKATENKTVLSREFHSTLSQLQLPAWVFAADHAKPTFGKRAANQAAKFRRISEFIGTGAKSARQVGEMLGCPTDKARSALSVYVYKGKLKITKDNLYQNITND